jgi:enoyl-CoA hydratase/carnithine racemase
MSSSSSESFVRRRVEGHVGIVTLARPQALNALSAAMTDQVAGALLATAADPSVWCLVLEAEGEKAFCVGADLKERNGLDDAGWMRNRSFMRAMFDSLRAVPQPTIASVFGFALGGGCELALSCDLIVAADDAVFGLPETRVGIVPGGGGTQLLPRKIGVARAKEMVFTGRRIDAREAHEWGLVNRVVPRKDLDAVTADVAYEVCRSSPVGVREAKRAIDRGTEGPLEHGLEIEENAWRRAVASADRREGIAAFNDKRDPEWTGR